VLIRITGVAHMRLRHAMRELAQDKPRDEQENNRPALE
jgi:hypothetical protein